MYLLLCEKKVITSGWLPGHLFTVDVMETTNVGRALQNTTCHPRQFHAVYSFVNVYSPNKPGAYSLMAHELGHNLGINDHVNNKDNLMFADVCKGCRCYHPDSVQILRTEMSRDCEESRKNMR